MAVCCICLFFDSLADVCRKGTMMVEEKLDRRSAYSRMVIEDTFLEMLREGPFSRINVAGLCRRADISRGTFYLHYVDIYDVLNHVLAKALMTAEQEGEGGVFPVLSEAFEGGKYPGKAEGEWFSASCVPEDGG